ncbi:MAG: hypothetical protein QGH60_12045 [Phycisphaerae bacterium]|jgi:hypothetical protein|nr:hypothetical protein [Phycisphaerae bacterium]
MNSMTLAVLVAYYLFLAVRWDLVRRPIPYLVGAGAVSVAILSGLFAVSGRGGLEVTMIFTVLGQLTAFVAGFAACCGAKLPIDPQSPPPIADEPDII